MNNDYFEREALQIGGLARKTLQDGISGTVLGSTSKGLFLTSGQKILFVTGADYKSPFNIQLFSLRNISDRITAGDTWRYQDEHLIFTQKDIRIATEGAEVWQPSTAPLVETMLQEQQHRMDSLLQRLQTLDPLKGWLFLADSFIQPQDSEAFIISEMTGRFLDCVRSGDLEGALQAGRSILGRGGGLTPSGDDWISGILLYYARTGQLTPFIARLGESLTVMAFESTTKISANRIEAACQGWSEELFLEIVDSLLISTSEISDQKVERLVNFGHSSGVDTCVGIAAALVIRKPVNRE